MPPMPAPLYQKCPQTHQQFWQPNHPAPLSLFSGLHCLQLLITHRTQIPPVIKEWRQWRPGNEIQHSMSENLMLELHWKSWDWWGVSKIRQKGISVSYYCAITQSYWIQNFPDLLCAINQTCYKITYTWLKTMGMDYVGNNWGLFWCKWPSSL